MNVKRSFSSIAVGGLFDRSRVVGGVGAAALAQCGEVGKRQDVLQGQPVELRALLVVLAKHADRL